MNFKVKNFQTKKIQKEELGEDSYKAAFHCDLACFSIAPTFHNIDDEVKPC